MNQNREEVAAFLEHFGVKGMKWGVRRAESRDARTQRLTSNTATKRDKLIRDADLDGGAPKYSIKSPQNFSVRGETFKKQPKPRLSDSDTKRQQAAHERRVQAGQTMVVGLLGGVALGMTVKNIAKRNF